MPASLVAAARMVANYAMLSSARQGRSLTPTRMRAVGASRSPRSPAGVTPVRFFAVGDPQTSFDHFASVLAGHELLAEDGWLRPEVGLVCMGDHFDYGAADAFSPSELAAAGREGLLILNWLAAHDPGQVIVLLGNHDAARVMELCSLDDQSFAQARELALRVAHETGSERARVEQRFWDRFTTIPTPAVVRRDFSTFSAAQREAVQRLLVAGRLRLAAVGVHRGRELLLTHAGVTRRELGLLELAADAGAGRISRALNALLRERVAGATRAWRAGARVPLDLSPLHLGGTRGLEAGGLLAHRPADPQRPSRSGAAAWAAQFGRDRPRRFDPRALPLGLVQACGHTRSVTSARELAHWASPEALAARAGALRSLHVSRTGVVYAVGLLEPKPEDALLWLLDVDLNSATADRVELLELERVTSS